MSLLTLLFVNCSSNKLGSVINSEPQKTNTGGSDNQSTETPTSDNPVVEPPPSLPDIAQPNPLPTPLPLPTPQPDSTTPIFTEYTAMVGYSSNGSFTDQATTNYKSIYSPQNIKSSGRENNPGLGGIRTYQIQITVSRDVLQGKKLLRYYLPAGTIYVDTSINTYWGPTTQKVAVKLKTPPQISGSDLIEGQTEYIWLDANGNRVSRSTGSLDWMRNLEVISEGYEFAGLVGPHINALLNPFAAGGSGTSPGSGYKYKTSSGGWVYIRLLELTGDSIMAFVGTITVDADIYDHWYSHVAIWDSQQNPF